MKTNHLKPYEKVAAADLAKKAAATHAAIDRLDEANDCDEIEVRISAAVEHVHHVVRESCGIADVSDVLFTVVEHNSAYYARAEIMESLSVLLTELGEGRHDRLWTK